MTLVEQIVSRDIPAAIVYQSDRVIAFLDHDPINAGHVLICPVEPICNYPDIPDDVMLEIHRVAKALYRRLEQKYQPQGISFIQNNGECNELEHYHLHIFPRFNNDGFGWTSHDYGVQTMAALKAKSLDLVINEPFQAMLSG